MSSNVMHEILMRATENMPMRQIEIGGETYLQRYFVRADADGTQHWLHRFVRDDDERYMHTHPWTAYARLLVGRYTERTPAGDRNYAAGEVNYITPDKAHRIITVKPDTWTLMTVLPGRCEAWHFLGDNEGDHVEMKSSPTDWWKSCGVRGSETHCQ